MASNEVIYMPEEEAKKLIKSTVVENLDKAHIKSPEEFSEHCIQTGRICFEIANRILQKHLSLSPYINPDLIRVEGYMHDFSKIFEGGEYHEIGTSHLILTEGEELGLVLGGTSLERKQILKEMASLVPPDYALYEALGGRDYFNAAVYPDKIGKFIERIRQLRRDFSKTKYSISIEELALPFTLSQQIALYADLTNVNGQIVSVREKLDEIEQRYGDSEGNFFDPKYAEMTRIIRPRILVVGKTIENLLM